MDTSALRGALQHIAANHRWTWTSSTRDMLQSLPTADDESHPFQWTSRLTTQELDELLADDEFMSAVARETDDLNALGEPSTPLVAYCSPEFGLTARLPQYAGGLGILSGDHLKAASDMGLPLVGVGLFYRQGVFHQVIEGGEQVETYDLLEPASLGAHDTGVVVEIPFPDRVVSAKVWRVDVGRIPLLLLDTDIDHNTDHDRNITDRLYMGFGSHRVDQEMVLGVGGARALAAVGWETQVHHLNEGHAGFIALELIDRVIESGDVHDAVDRVRDGLVFTTHTPVPAGIDTFDQKLLSPYLRVWAHRWGVDLEEIWRLGIDPADRSKFNMAALCLRVSGAANGVSRLHGEVSRGLFADVVPASEIGYITNGVHARTWTGQPVQELLDSTVGVGWADGDAEVWSMVDAISDERITLARRQGSRLLSEFVANKTGKTIDPDAVIFGFARRFAPYKRANLMLRERERLAALLSDDERPIHVVLAGKAHPSDGHGKALLAEIVQFAESSAANGRFTFVPDYDMDTGLNLVQGSDIWLNNPIRPREASGTSGEKIVLNGGLNCSILDGWWAEMYDGANGWAIQASDSADPEQRDTEEASALLDLMFEIRNVYYAGSEGLNARIRHAWKTLGPRVTAARMVAEYRDLIYRPAINRVTSRS